MAIPHRLNDSVRRSLGEKPAEDLVSWMDDVDDRRSEFAEFRETMRADMAELRQEVAARFSVIEKELKDLRGVESTIRLEVRDARNEVIKWSFLFWIVTLGSMFLGRMLP
jgi:hypothetical protein